MCVAIPARILERRPGHRALAEVGGVAREVSIHPLPDVKAGDYVLLYMGVAVERVSPQEAQEVLDLWKAMALAAPEDEYSEKR